MRIPAGIAGWLDGFLSGSACAQSRRAMKVKTYLFVSLRGGCGIGNEVLGFVQSQRFGPVPSVQLWSSALRDKDRCRIVRVALFTWLVFHPFEPNPSLLGWSLLGFGFFFASIAVLSVSTGRYCFVLRCGVPVSKIGTSHLDLAIDQNAWGDCGHRAVSMEELAI